VLCLESRNVINARCIRCITDNFPFRDVWKVSSRLKFTYVNWPDYSQPKEKISMRIEDMLLKQAYKRSKAMPNI
jgi:hypothetical protein